MTERIEQITDVVMMLAESFGYKSNESTYLAYLHGLSDVPIETVQAAAIKAMTTLEWFPKIIEMRDLCGVSEVKPSADDRAMVAWNAVRASISKIGGYRSVDFDDPITNATIRAMGGWNRFCESKPGKDLDTWLKKDFVATYGAYMSSGISAEQARPLAGIDAASRSAIGYSLPDPVQVCLGLPEIPKNLVRGVIRDDRKPVAALTEVRQFVKSLDVPGLIGQSESIPISRAERRKAKRQERQEKSEAAKDLRTGPRLSDVDGKREAMIERLKQFKPRGKRGKKESGQESKSEETDQGGNAKGRGRRKSGRGRNGSQGSSTLHILQAGLQQVGGRGRTGHDEIEDPGQHERRGRDEGGDGAGVVRQDSRSD